METTAHFAYAGNQRKGQEKMDLEGVLNCYFWEVAPWHRVLSEQYYTLLRACLDKQVFLFFGSVDVID